MTLWAEINSQAEVLAAAHEGLRKEVSSLGQWIRDSGATHLVLAARGSSDNAGRYAQYLWGARNGLSVALTTPSLFGAYSSPPHLAGALVVGISQSGESPDLLGVIEEANRQGRPTLAITNNAESPMAQLATRSLELGVGIEEAVAATKTYTGQLLAIALVSAAIAGEAQEEQFRRLAPAVNEVLAAGEQIRKVAVDFASHDRCVVIGRGFHHATAHEWALKIAELSYLVAQPFSSADFRHGPIALVEPGLAVLAVASQGPLFAEISELLEEVTSAGAKVVAISDRDDLPAEYLLRIPTTPEWLSPIPAIVAAQVFTYHLTVARGYDPDRPRGLRKVTRTV
ncbi:MAG TPA: SIS domain-containing protein [Acidimicrobiia bacterium]|nr:SIS domain-containing protein [Acidimicrobiia bacterium]